MSASARRTRCCSRASAGSSTAATTPPGSPCRTTAPCAPSAPVSGAADEPDVLVGGRRECPVVEGRGAGEQFLASGIPAFLAHTRRVQEVQDGEIVVVAPGGADLLTAAGEPVERAVEII